MERLGGPGRVLRACELFRSVHRALQHQIHREHPDLSDREVMLRTAERLYQGEPRALELLRRLRQV
jgi:hypothetical protein